MTKNINANIKAERNFFVRIMPLFLKNIALKFSYKAFGKYSYTTVISNMGPAGAPKEFDNLIERYDCMLGKSLVNSINIGVISHNNNLSVSFTSAIKEKVIEKNFCRLISALGIGVTIFTNVK
ncbi:MAG: hypothetical protein IJX26_01525 [Clostridia bacterium]|nr:hypothetical protein [Clostridia bacterium]